MTLCHTVGIAVPLGSMGDRRTAATSGGRLSPVSARHDNIAPVAIGYRVDEVLQRLAQRDT
jgi:hypothetical protein